MKKWIICIVALFSIVSCSKEDNEEIINGYSVEEKEVLNVLHGKWKSENASDPEELTFTIFGHSVIKNGGAGGVMYFHGNATRKFTYLNKGWETWNMYFYVNTTKHEIAMYGINEDETFSIVQTKTYEYKIINNNTIRLHDKSLSWMHEYNYNRIQYDE